MTLPTYEQMKLLIEATQAKRAYHRHMAEEWEGQAARDNEKYLDRITRALATGLDQDDVAEYMQRED